MVINSSLIKKLKQHPVINAVYQVSQKVNSPIYLVGGAVRDLLMGILPEKDFDFVTQNELVRVAHLFSKTVSGNLIQWSLEPPHFRVIFYLNNNRIEVDFSSFQGDNLYQDLLNRDFTINAMALMTDELFQEGEIKIYDPLKGEKDLQKRILSITSPLSFDKDPLRVLRAIRIAKARNLTIDKKTKVEIYRHKDRLPFSAAERIRNEFFKILSFSGTRDSLNLLEDLKLLSILLPETEEIKDQQKPNNLSRWEHSLETVEWCEWALDHLGELFPKFKVDLKAHFSEEIEAGVERQSILKLGSLLHEYKNTFQGDRGNIGKEIARRFKLGKRSKRILENVISHHAQVLRIFQQEKINNRVYFRFFQDFDSEGLDLIVLSWADFIASFPERFGGPLDLKLRKLVNDLVSYYFKEYLVTNPQPLISGKEIIEYFGLKEGKIIGDLLSLVAKAEAEGLLLSRKEAVSYVEKLVKGMGKATININNTH